MSKTVNISLCICTYNRCEQLRLTLQSLVENGTVFVEGDEILIVDNNSMDLTKNVVTEYQDKLPLTYHFESEQGLSAARNKGLSEFKNSVLIFIDDDITVSQSYIEEYRHAFLSYPKAGFFGGKIHIDWGGKPPAWYQSTELSQINGLLVYYDQGDEDKHFESSSLLPYGANFALTRSLIDKVGLFSQRYGVRGKQLGRGEETDYFRRALQLGFKGMYVARAKVFHRFHKQRMSLNYLYKYGIQKGVAAVKLDAAKPQKTAMKMTHQALAGIYQLLKFRRDRFYQCIINIGITRGIQIATNDCDE